MGLTYFHESTLPRLNHIVWCCLPNEDGSPGESVRPALIRGSKRHPPSQRGALMVSYGTVVLDTTRFGHLDLIIQKASRLHDLDLPMAVRFDLSLWNWLPWAAEFFQPPAHSLYIVAGALNDTELARLRRRLLNRGILRPM